MLNSGMTVNPNSIESIPTLVLALDAWEWTDSRNNLAMDWRVEVEIKMGTSLTRQLRLKMKCEHGLTEKGVFANTPKGHAEMMGVIFHE